MIVKIKVKNFLSFKDLQEISFIQGEDQSNMDSVINTEHINLLTFGVIYGANASGKSNFIKAIEFAKRKIANKVTFKDRESYFKLDKKCKLEPSYFEFELYLDGKYYAYGFEIILNKDRIISEWLIELRQTEEIIIYSKDIKKDEWIFDTDNIGSNEFKALLKYAFDIFKNSNGQELFLYHLKYFPIDAESVEDYDVFTKIEIFLRFSVNIGLGSAGITQYHNFLSQETLSKMSNLVQFFDTGIKKVDLIEIELDVVESHVSANSHTVFYDMVKEVETYGQPKVIKTSAGYFVLSYVNDEVVCQTLVFKQANDVTFKFSELSDGTKRLIDIIDILLTHHCVYIIDEIDRYLHPLLMHKLIEIYLEVAKSNNVQLILTTHDTGLLDKNFISRDQVWFIDKNDNGESKLYELEQYQNIFDNKLQTAYLEGRYRGIPNFNSYYLGDLT
ncbi:MAG: hypothetical protein ATN35_06710 [Epulopiscium sp. Nele67-Bin004]|nr:MAG: hypothetical protein ATN35_06710 [Epulopiscium sp. Nele67-Bin004]